MALARAEVACRDYESAIATIDKSLALSESGEKGRGPSVSYCYTCRAHCWFMQQDYKKAQRDLDRAIQLDPSNAERFLERRKCSGNSRTSARRSRITTMR